MGLAEGLGAAEDRGPASSWALTPPISPLHPTLTRPNLVLGWGPAFRHSWAYSVPAKKLLTTTAVD